MGDYMTDAPIDVDQMKSDIAAGTEGPWVMHMLEIGTGCWEDWGDGDYAFSDYQVATAHAGMEAQANARRIARVPDLEAAYIALIAENAKLREVGGALAGICTEANRTLASTGYNVSLAIDMRKALTAYRNATGDA